MTEIDFKDVQYVYSTDCGLARLSNYCTVSKSKRKRAELSDIFNALDVFKKYHLQVKVLGGNPSDEDDFPSFIEYMNKIGLDYVVTDNALNYFKLADSKVNGVMFSLDTLGKNDIGGCSYRKSMLAKSVIPWIRSRVDYIGANIVMNKKNIGEIEKIIEFLTENNAVANLCPLIIGQNKNFDYMFRIKESPYALNEFKNDKLKELCKRLIEMKKSDYLIGCPEEYLEKLPDVILKTGFGWNCRNISSIPILRVNNDLTLMICSDIEGREVSKYTIFDLEEKYNEINTEWILDENRRQCCEQDGCYWSNIVIADIYRSKGYGTLEATRKNL